MPRVTINKKKYKILDLKGWIVGQMKVHGLKQKDIADALGVSQPVVSLMLRIPNEKDRTNIDQISYGDLLTLFDLFGTSDEEKARLLTL